MTPNPEQVARIECKLDDDSRLLAGAIAIVEHVALRAGLSENAAGGVAEAAQKGCTVFFQACRESGIQRPAIRLGAAEFRDRVEVTIDMIRAVEQGSGPLQHDGAAECVEKIRKALNAAAVDSATVELHEGKPCVTLVKNCGAPKRQFAS